VTTTTDTSERMDPTTRFVRSLPGKYFMVREAAAMLGVRHPVLRALLKEDKELGPSFCVFFGKVKVYLYTAEDIERVRVYLTQRKRVFRNTDITSSLGRPQKWTEEQRKERQRLYSSSHYYRRRAEKLDAEGRTDEAEKAKAKVADIEKQLRKQEQQ